MKCVMVVDLISWDPYFNIDHTQNILNIEFESKNQARKLLKYYNFNIFKNKWYIWFKNKNKKVECSLILEQVKKLNDKNEFVKLIESLKDE